MKKTVEIAGIFSGISKKGNPFKILYLMDVEESSSSNFKGRRVYQAFVRHDFPFLLGDNVDVVIHHNECIVLEP